MALGQNDKGRTRRISELVVLLGIAMLHLASPSGRAETGELRVPAGAAATLVELERTGRCDEDGLAILRAWHDKAPEAARPSLIRALLAREDWPSLIELHEQPGPLPERERLLSLSKLLAKAQRFDEAARTISSLHAAEPTAPEPCWLAAYSAFQLGLQAAAAQSLDACSDAWRAAPREDAYVMRALLHFQQGEFEPAQRLLLELISLNPNNASAHNALGRVHAAAGRVDAARTSFGRAAAIRAALSDSESRQLRLSAWSRALSRALREGRLEDCEQLLSKMIPEADPALRSRLYLALSNVLEQAGRLDEARTARDAALEPGLAR